MSSSVSILEPRFGQAEGGLHRFNMAVEETSVEVKTDDRLGTYEEFWPFYLKEHSKSKTRHLHYLGSGLAITALCAASVKRDARLLAAVPLAGRSRGQPVVSLLSMYVFMMIARDAFKSLCCVRANSSDAPLKNPTRSNLQRVH